MVITQVKRPPELHLNTDPPNLKVYLIPVPCHTQLRLIVNIEIEVHKILTPRVDIRNNPSLVVLLIKVISRMSIFIVLLLD